MDKSRSVLKLKVSIKDLKTFALTLPKGSHLRDLILSEDDELGVDEFLSKMDDWLRLLRMEFSL